MAILTHADETEAKTRGALLGMVHMALWQLEDPRAYPAGCSESVVANLRRCYDEYQAAFDAKCAETDRRLRAAIEANERLVWTSVES